MVDFSLGEEYELDEELSGEGAGNNNATDILGFIALAALLLGLWWFFSVQKEPSEEWSLWVYKSLEDTLPEQSIYKVSDFANKYSCLVKGQELAIAVSDKYPTVWIECGLNCKWRPEYGETVCKDDIEVFNPLYFSPFDYQ